MRHTQTSTHQGQYGRMPNGTRAMHSSSTHTDERNRGQSVAARALSSRWRLRGAGGCGIRNCGQIHDSSHPGGPVLWLRSHRYMPSACRPCVSRSAIRSVDQSGQRTGSGSEASLAPCSSPRNADDPAPWMPDRPSHEDQSWMSASISDTSGRCRRHCASMRPSWPDRSCR